MSVATEGAGPLISVVVCTRRRPDLLAALLAGLARQVEPPDFEVVVVDNGPDPATRRTVEALAPELPAARCVEEPTPGLSHARNRGWHEARAPWIAYVDDDCRVPAGWLAAAAEVIAGPEPDVFGGPYYPFYLAPKPPWFKDEYGTGGVLRPDAGRVDRNLRGGNLFVRRELLVQFGGFDPAFGMAGAAVAYGDDTELQDRLRRERPETVFYYHPGLAVEHLVRPEKTRLSWLVRSSLAKGFSGERVRTLRGDGGRYRRAAVASDAARTALAMLADLARASWARDRERYPRLRTYLHEETARYLRKLGRLGARWRAASAKQP